MSRLVVTRPPELRASARRAGLMLGLALGGCTAALGPGVSGTVNVAPPGADALHMVYLGSGGWILEHRGAQVLTAPLFSNPGLVRTGLAEIEADTLVIDRYLGEYDVSGARVILVGHAHYDHLMDVPRSASAHAVRARVLGSRTTAHILGCWSGLADRVDIVDEGTMGDQETVGRWIHYGTRVRIMPLRSEHGPHLHGITLYEGIVDEPRQRPPRRATDWLEGQTLAFLVDFLDEDGGIAFRVYYQDATAPPPLGFAPEALIAAHPVDVAILVPATFEEVDWHPEALVANLRPHRILLGHWEDFFEPVDQPAESVPFTDIAGFERRLARVFHGDVWRPDRFTEFRLPAVGGGG